MSSHCIFFFDEIDSVLGCSSSSSDAVSDFKSRRGNSIETIMLSNFLHEMDGDDGNDDNKVQGNDLALSSTDRPNVLDLALL